MSRLVSDRRVAQDLRDLNRALRDAGLGEDLGGGLLGGEDGYPVKYENDVFALHPYCWCEQFDCPWCAPCECPDEATLYLVDGAVVDFDVWVDAPRERRTVTEVPEKRCLNCQRGPDREAPNFLHKPTGTKVWFYKYVGRGMRLHIPGNWEQVITEARESLHP